MEHYIGLTLSSTTDINQTLVVINAFENVIINLYCHTKSGDVKFCGICLNQEQKLALIKFLNTDLHNG